MPKPVDGRHLRRERGRQAVIDATVSLVLEGFTPPSAEQVAKRAQVSVASLFRYFETLDDLQEHTVQRCMEQFAHLQDIPSLGEGDLEARINRFVKAKVTLFESIDPMARLVRARALDQERHQALLGSHRTLTLDQVREHFAPELSGLGQAAADDLAMSISTATAFEAWSHLSVDHKRSSTQIRRAWTTLLSRLLSVD